MADTQRTLASWLQQRAGEWERLSVLLERQRDRKDEELEEVLELVHGFRAVGRDLSLARSTVPDSAVTRHLEALFVRMHDVIYQRPRALGRDLVTVLRDDVPQVIRAMRGSILATVALFVGNMIAAWLLVTFNPELISLIASEAMVEHVQRGELWTDDLLNIMPSSVLSFQIMTNNIMVSLIAFVLGALYGLGTLYIITINGFMLGGVFAFTAQYGLHWRLFEFIVAHGVVELSVVCLAGAAGVQLGEAIIRPGLRARAAAFQQAISRAGKLLVVAVPFLIGAGLIEGYISPNDSYSMAPRVVIGVCYGILFWSVLSGRIWQTRLIPARGSS